MKIAIVRGDFVNPWELQNFEPLLGENKVSLFAGKNPITPIPEQFADKTVSLFSPTDLNLGKISRIRMAILNRLFTDAHILFGLENSLRGFDIAHCAETYYGFTHQCVQAKKNRSVKAVVATVWENIPFNNEGIPGRKEYKKQAFVVVDKFLAVTEGAKCALIREGCPPEKTEVLQPGINLKHFSPQRITEFHGLEKNENIKLLFVGRLEPEKGILRFLIDNGNIFQRHKNVDLVIVGKGSQEDSITRFAAQRYPRQIHLLGNIDYEDMPKVYSLCDCLIHPVVGSKTWIEQYGMVLIEAMACALPIIATGVGAISEVIGEAGIIVERNEIGKAVENIIENRPLRETLSKKALSIAKRKYDRDIYARKLAIIYERLLSGK